jgi:hypothetical protein
MSPVFFLALAAAVGVVVVGVIFVKTWDDQNVPVRIISGAALFSLMLLVLLAVRGALA